MKPAFCATCIEEREDLHPRMSKGRLVWLCSDCCNAVGILKEHSKDRELGVTNKLSSHGRYLRKSGRGDKK